MSRDGKAVDAWEQKSDRSGENMERNGKSRDDQRYFDLILFVEFDLKSQLELDLNLDSSCTLI